MFRPELRKNSLPLSTLRKKSCPTTYRPSLEPLEDRCVPATIVGGSTLLTTTFANQLETWLGMGPITLTNVFTKTTSNGMTAANFHSAVDGKGMTFAVEEVLATRGNTRQIIGGYNPVSWNGSLNSYTYSTSDSTRTAFLFNLTTTLQYTEKLTAVDGNVGQYQTYNTSSYGPTFGGGHDLYVDSNLATGYSYQYSYGPSGTAGTTFLGKPSSTQVDYGTVEVFTIAQTPATITSLSATTANEGATLLVNGSNFTSSSVVQFNGVAATTTFVSGTQLSVQVPESGTYTVKVVDPGNGTSNGVSFTSTDAPLTASGVSFTAQAGTAFTGTVATFTDGNLFAPLSDFTTAPGGAKIDWGDGTVSAGTVSQPGGTGTAFVVAGTHTYSTTLSGSFTVRVSIVDVDGSQTKANGTALVQAYIPPTPPVPPGVIITGADAGGVGQVNVYDATGALKAFLLPFGTAFTGGVRVAAGDVNGDGTLDYIAAAGPGGGPQVSVYDGKTNQLLYTFFAIGTSGAGGLPASATAGPGIGGGGSVFGFTGGLFVAAGDPFKNGYDDIIVGAGAGGGPQVLVFDGKSGALVSSFYAFSPTFRGGVHVAAGDVDGDGKAEIIVGAGAGGGPQVEVFDGSGNLRSSFFAFVPGFTGGVWVAAGDTNGDGKAEVIVGAGAGGGPQVEVFDGSTLNLLSSFYAMSPRFTGGVRVAVTDAHKKANIIAAAGRGGGPQVETFDGSTLALLGSFFAYSPGFTFGVMV